MTLRIRRILCRCGTVPLVVMAGYWIQSSAGAQITARQGKPAAGASKRFESPMILSMPVPKLKGLRDSRSYAFTGFDEYSCQGVSIASLTIDVATLRTGERKYTFKGKLLLGGSYDRLVSLTFSLAEGEASVYGRASDFKIHAEGDERKRFSVHVLIDESTAELLDRARNLTLQVEMRVQTE